MKALLFFLLIPVGLTAQQWQTIPHEHFNMTRYTGGYVPSTNYSQFEINPFDGSMWFLNNTSLVDFDIKKINYSGMLTVFDTSNNPFMDGNSRHNYGVEFINSNAYVMHGYDGIYRYDEVAWSTASVGIDQCIDICSDLDTLHIARQSQDFVSIKDGMTLYNNWSNFKRIRSRNGSIWGSGSQSSGIVKYLPAASSIQTFDPSTTPLLDNSNHDFKFARNSDVLYVAGEQGFSLASGNQFFDTITMFNSTNMPYASIIEFEFDSQDNIWAVFGDGGSQGFYPLYLGYYDQATESWSMIYDGNNSPIDFTERLDIEIDLNDNLWVCDRNDLHVLKINTTPGWLSLAEEEQKSVSIHPNPSNGIFNIEIDNSHEVSDIVVHDIAGNEVHSGAFTHQLRLDILPGSYMITLLNGKAILGRERIIVR